MSVKFEFLTKNTFVLWVITRAWVILSGFQVIWYPHSESLFSDVRLYDWWAGNMVDGHFPINDPMWQYPPLAAVVFLLGYLIAGHMVGFVSLALAADAGIFLLLLRTSQSTKQQNPLPPLIWVAAPVLIGPIMLGRFDVFPTFMAVGATLAMRKPVTSGVYLAFGTLLKAWPILGLISVPRSLYRRVGAAYAITLAVGFGLLKMWWPGSLGFLIGQRDRGLQIESLGALPFMWKNAGPGNVHTKFRYGAIEVMSSHTGVVSLLLTASGLIAIGLLVVRRLQGRLETVPMPDIFLLVVLVAMITSRVLSPQYNVWVIGLLAVCAFLPAPEFTPIAILLAISAFTGQLLYPWMYIPFQGGEVLPTLVQTIRVVTLLLATIMLWRSVNKRTLPAQVRTESAPSA